MHQCCQCAWVGFKIIDNNLGIVNKLIGKVLTENDNNLGIVDKLIGKVLTENDSLTGECIEAFYENELGINAWHFQGIKT